MSAADFRLPDLGEGLEDAEIANWLVAVGDTVAVDQPVAEVVTAKATVELPSPFAGVVLALHAHAGDVVKVGAPLVTIGSAEELPADPSAARSGPDGAAPGEPVGLRAAVEGDGDGRAATDGPGTGAAAGSGSVLVGYGTRPERRRRRSGSTTSAPAPTSETVSGRPPVMSPVVRRLARELHVELEGLEGSGPEGAITRGDVERAAVAGRLVAPDSPKPAPPAPSVTADAARSPGSPAPSASVPPAARAGDERIPIRGAHRIMAERLARSRREIPEATVWVDVDATGLLEVRRLTDDARPEGSERPGLTSWLARLCVLGLQRFPLLNSRLEGDEIVVGRAVHLGIATQTDRGLVVPVVHHAGELSLLELDEEIRRLTAGAREGRLTTSELSGGTCTLNNYGVFGVDGSAAIINLPEVAIVGVGRIFERPWVSGGAVAVRPVTELTLSFDHRVCDGGVAGGFLRFLADCVESPVRLLTL